MKPKEFAKALAARAAEEVAAGRSPVDDDSKGLIAMTVISWMAIGYIIKHFKVEEHAETCTMCALVIEDHHLTEALMKDDPDWRDAFEKVSLFGHKLAAEFAEPKGKATAISHSGLMK